MVGQLYVTYWSDRLYGGDRPHPEKQHAGAGPPGQRKSSMVSAGRRSPRLSSICGRPGLVGAIVLNDVPGTAYFILPSLRRGLGNAARGDAGRRETSRVLRRLPSLEDAAAIRGWMLAHNQHAVATACVVLSVPATTEMPGYSRSWTQML